MKKGFIAALAATLVITGVMAPMKAKAITVKEQSPMSVQAVSYSSYSYPVLRKGSTGTSVRTLQRMLYNLGYRSVGTIDGIFGDKTDTAVRNFQSNYNLTVDGIVGPQTWDALNKAYADKFGPY